MGGSVMGSGPSLALGTPFMGLPEEFLDINRFTIYCFGRLVGG